MGHGNGARRSLHRPGPEAPSTLPVLSPRSKIVPVHCVNGGNSDHTATDVGQVQGKLSSMWLPRKARLLIYSTEEEEALE